jgi:hypothetical protein
MGGKKGRIIWKGGKDGKEGWPMPMPYALCPIPSFPLEERKDGRE